MNEVTPGLGLVPCIDAIVPTLLQCAQSFCQARSRGRGLLPGSACHGSCQIHAKSQPRINCPTVHELSPAMCAHIRSTRFHFGTHASNVWRNSARPVGIWNHTSSILQMHEDVGCTWVARETMHLWPPTLHLSAWLAPVAAAPSFSTTTLAPAIVFFMSPWSLQVSAWWSTAPYIAQERVEEPAIGACVLTLSPVKAFPVRVSSISLPAPSASVFGGQFAQFWFWTGAQKLPHPVRTLQSASSRFATVAEVGRLCNTPNTCSSWPLHRQNCGLET